MKRHFAQVGKKLTSVLGDISDFQGTYYAAGIPLDAVNTKMIWTDPLAFKGDR